MARTDPPTKKKPQKKTTGTDGLLKEQIGKMGGTEEDFNLVKSKGKQKEVSSEVVDHGLNKDVSQFLKDLKLGKPSKVSKQKPQPAPVSKPVKEATSSKNSKSKAAHPASKKHPISSKKATPKTAEASASAPPPPTKAVPLPLPTKITVDSKSRFTFQPVSSWHSALPPLKQPAATLSVSQLEPLLFKAANLHATDVQVFKASSSASGSEAAFFSKIISSGTLSDRLSALTLLVQSSPLHNLHALETLKTMAERGKGSGGREESLKALRCIVDWWIGGGAPERKLKYFRDQPLASSEITDEYLVLWYFEDWLKKYFFAVLQILEALSLDPLVYVRTQALRMIATLLREKPEQEQNLLRLLVNKLGDNERSLSSRTSHHILELLQKHPSMKSVVVKEMLALVLRPPSTAVSASTPSEAANRRIKFDDDAATTKKKEAKTTTNQHARYYATITFNQIVLTPQDKDVSDSLLDVYFELFKELLGEDPAVEQEQEEEEEFKVDSKGRILNERKKENRGGKKEILRKGDAGFTEGVEDANSKLISAILTGVNRALPFCSRDDNRVPLLKHIETLFKITHTSTFNISLQALVLIQQVSASSPSSPITNRYFRTLYASLQDPRLASSNKQAMYLNLLFKSIKADENQDRPVAMVRRFLQVLVSGGNSGAVEFVAGGLFLLGELFSSIPGLRSSLSSVPREAKAEYDPQKRDPQYANAGSVPLWELTPLLNHFHPTIALHANQLLRAVPLTASADLSLNTLSHFLDRFVYKNPKQKKKDNAEEGKGGSAMQPMASALDGVKLVRGEVLDKSHLVNEVKFANKSAKDVRPDEVFFHKYFTTKAKGKKSAIVLEESSDDEESDEKEEMDLTGDEEAKNASSDEEEEELIWNAMKASMPKTGKDDENLDFSGNENEDEDVDSALQDMSDDEDMLDIVEDDDDILSDSNFGLIGFDGSGDENDDVKEEEWGGVGVTSGKRRRGDEEESAKTRKKKKALPTFASYDDYAKVIDEGPENDI